LVAANGAVVWSGAYDAFGNCEVGVETVVSNLRLPGQYYDAETGLYYNLNRYYDPKIGRYLQPDPAGDGLNPYAYVGGNPVNAIDPLGLCALRMIGGGADIWAGIGLIGGALSGPPGWLAVGAGIVGGLTVLNGADNLIAGGRSAISGEYTRSFGEAAIHRHVRNELAADLLYTGSQLLLGYAGIRADRAMRAVYHVNTGGLRNEIPLTASQQAEAVEYAKSLGVSDDMIIVSENMNTGYANVFGRETLYIGTDVLPSTNPNIARLSANSRVSMRGTLAHEIIGHRAASLAGKTHRARLLEEVQASIRAARYAPGLSSTERITLLRDAIERIYPKMGIRQVKNMLWID
jgi:RHS repeat-associated protein